MPLKRTPPKIPIVSETDTESIESAALEKPSATGRLKRKRESELAVFMEEVRVMFEKQNAKLENLESSLTDIKTQNDTINLFISTLSTKYDEVQKELESLRQESKEHVSYIRVLENRLENFEKQSCVGKVEIRNIPKSKSESREDLCDAVLKIGNSLNLDLKSFDIKDVFRPYSKPDIIKPVIVEFTSVLTKEKYLRSFKKLTIQERNEKINTGLFDTETPRKQLYISEYLTPREKRLFFLARDFAGSNGFDYCWTSYGKIYMRRREGLPHIRINDEADLTKLKIT